MKKTLAEIAELTCGRLAGDGDICVTGVSSLDDASSSEITFADEKHIYCRRGLGIFLHQRYMWRM